MYHSIKKAGGKLVRYTEYLGIGHDSWVPAWEESSLSDWMLAQKKSVEKP